jgi:phage virion morphogenesis protein
VSKVKVTVNGTQITKLLRNLQDTTPLLQNIGDHLVASSRARIRTTKADPDGNAWEPWAPATRAARIKAGTAGSGLLYDTGTLFNSITASISRNRAVVSTTVPYATYLQNGTINMPARPFLGVSQGDMDAIRRFVTQHLLKH